MDSTKIIEKIKNNDYQVKVEYPKKKRYSENHIFDENKSVKWNREEVLRQNDVLNEELKAYRRAQSEKYSEFENDVVKYLIDNYNINNSEEIARKIYLKAYSESHSSGLYEVFTTADDIASFMGELLNLY